MILIGFGSNLRFCGRESPEIIAAAVHALSDIVNLQAVSRFYASPAWPDPSDPNFVNGVVAATSQRSPTSLLEALHAIEAGFGRVRGVKNAPRTLDLDLLSYGDLVCGTGQEHGLMLPHPAISRRDFVLAPLNDIAPTWTHPVSGLTPGEMLDALEDRSAVPIPARADFWGLNPHIFKGYQL